MTIQEAYNKGLDDAENCSIDNLLNMLNDSAYDIPFPNPRMEIVRQVIKDRSDFFHSLKRKNTNVGRFSKKKLLEQKEILEKVKI